MFHVYQRRNGHIECLTFRPIGETSAEAILKYWSVRDPGGRYFKLPEPQSPEVQHEEKIA